MLEGPSLELVVGHVQIIWDLEDDVEGNYWHIVVEGHGIAREEVEVVLLNRGNPTAISRTSGNPITFGWTTSGKYIAVLWEEVLDDPRIIFPLTAYEVPPPAEE